ncbi:efflux RND transporter periplasmic adaptor subunit [Poseidonocella sedimentorum]|uniref:HlyD family secretion protein n=1 Tax=Poseidonocella sedimentorum TaxID=871652 RepID=A0A1I6EBG7_9RHOB|nr:HlyD family efflux transporter periplasmic adaptor subunit [Poseidonocella sedimentorum]SFR14931.1 HlyD family secretion protein [Poseidonocella sedimentorum]
MRFLRHSLTGLFLVAVTLAMLVWAGDIVRRAVEDNLAREPRMPQAREQVYTVNVVTVAPETLTPVLTTYGEVRSRRTLDIRAAVGGTVVEMAPEFEEGGQVNAGALLLRIDPQNAEAERSRAEADLQDAEFEARDAERALELAQDELEAARAQATLRETALTRQKDLAERGVGSASSVETAELALSSAVQSVLSHRQSLANAEARIDQARTALARAEIALEEAVRSVADTQVTAQFAGTLTDVVAVEGGIVSGNEQLARLVDPDRLEVAVRLSTAQYGRLLDESGALRPAPATVYLDLYGLGLMSRGVVSRGSASVTSGETGRVVFVQLDEVRGLKPGDFVSVEIEEPPLDGVARLPATAVDSSQTVLALGEDGRLEVIDTPVLRRQGDDVLVDASAIAGRSIVAERTPILGAGIKVRPLNPAGGAPADGDQSANGAGPAADEMVELTDERRAQLVSLVEGNQRMPAEAKERVLAQLRQPRVPAQIIARLEERIGG